MSRPMHASHRPRTRLAVTALAAAAALALTACSDSAGSGDADGTTTITLLSWSGEDVMQPILDAFEEAHPDVAVEASYAPPVAEYIQTLQTQVLSGTAPDVFLIAAENKTNLIEGEHVVDLSGEDFVEDVAAFNLETYGRDGAYYGLSLSSWAAGYAYDVDLLAEHGYDALPATWDEFLAMCEDLQSQGVTPFLEAVDGLPTTLAAFIGAKNSEMEPGLDSLIFDGSSTFEEQWTPELEQYGRLFTEGVLTSDVAGLTGDQVLDEFVNDRVAVISAGPWWINSIRESAPDKNFMFAPVPALEDGKPYVAGAAAPGYAVNPRSDEAHQAAAKTFLAWLASPEGTEMINDLTNDVTVTADFEPVVDPVFEPLAENIRSGELYLPMIAWQRAEDVLNLEAVAQLQRLAQGQVEPVEVAQALDAKLAAS